jgi:hypothetical protein
MKTIRYIKIDGTEVVEAKTKEPSLDKMQDFVDGPVERFQLLVDNPKGGKPLRATMWVNEEGGLIGLPVNKTATDITVHGAQLMGTACLQTIRGNVILIHTG